GRFWSGAVHLVPDGARGVGTPSPVALCARHLVTEASLPGCGLSRGSLEVPDTSLRTPRYGTPRYRLEVPDTSLPDTSLPGTPRCRGLMTGRRSSRGARHLVTGDTSLPRPHARAALLSRCQTP